MWMGLLQVCPERIDLIHKNYRKLCNLLVDVDEWGQVIIINMLTRYARTQFTNPNADVSQQGVCSCDILLLLFLKQCCGNPFQLTEFIMNYCKNISIEGPVLALISFLDR